MCARAGACARADERRCERRYADGVGKVANRKRKEQSQTIGEAFRRKRILAEVRQEAAEFAVGLKRNQDPAEAVQFILDNMITAYEYATQNVMQLPEEDYFVEVLGGKRLHHWITEQERLALQIVHVAGKAAGMGIAERQVRLQESQAAIFATVVEAALQQAGLNAELRRSVHQGIATRLEDIEGTAVELSAIPRRAA